MDTKSRYVLKAVDYISLNIKDSEGYGDIADDAEIKVFTWKIPKGIYTSVLETPPVTTVSLTDGVMQTTGTPTTDMVIRYVNGCRNQYASSGSPVIAYASSRAANSLPFTSAGEMVVTDRPEFIRIEITDAEGDGLLKEKNVGTMFTLKFCYYDKLDNFTELVPFATI